MDKSEFITYLITLYGGFMDDKKQDLWIKDCSDVLEDYIDFTKFRFHFLHEFDSRTINNIPSPQWLYRESRQFAKEKISSIEKTQQYLEKRKMEKELAIPCPPEIKAKIEALKEKLKNKEI